jgi:hypothetical protein
MARRLAAAAVLTAALGTVSAVPAHAADCGPVLDAVARQLPEPARELYLKVCGV